MTTYLSPGVYIREVPSGPQPIAGAPTSAVAIIGSTEKGPAHSPYRVSSWSDFVGTFGGPVAGSYTAEAMYGYFENGGPAAYVVRVDGSTAATWQVIDKGGNEVFIVTAASPGRWANDLALTIAPDNTGGSGQAYVATVTAAVAIAAAAAGDVAVSSAIGVSVGDAIEVGGSAATVDGIVGNTLTVTAGDAIDVVEGDGVASVASGSTLVLAAANGMKSGDVLVITLPDRSRISRLVTQVDPLGSGARLTLDGNLPADVPGGSFDDRVALLNASIGMPTAAAAFGGLQWDESVPPVLADIQPNFRAWASNGRRLDWNAGTSSFEFADNSEIPAGPITVEARLSGKRFSESPINLDNPSVADLDARYGFFPTGGRLELTASGGGAITVTMTAAGTFDPGAANLAQVFVAARYVMPDPATAVTAVLVKAARAPEVGDTVHFNPANRVQVTGVEAHGADTYELQFVATDLSGVGAANDVWRLQAFQTTEFRPARFSLTVTDSTTGVSQTFPNLAVDEDHPQYYAADDTINGANTMITVGPRTANAALAEATMPAAATVMAAGTSVLATDSQLRNGFALLEGETEPAMVICPDALTVDDPLLQSAIVNAMVGHCEDFRRFAIVDTPDLDNDQDLADWRLQNVASTYAATYAPHVTMINVDETAAERIATVPPSGFVAGVFARTDRERGVHKAPGNERVRGIVGLGADYTQRRQDLLNPAGVNLIRTFPGRGMRIWGARNATDDTNWRYVNVRRLFNFIETSVERGTQWVVFEPNTKATWLRVRVSVENFLDEQWRAGALAGATPEEAFRVQVGLGETMTESQVDLGLVIVRVGIAPAKPAEFVVFEFSHKRLSA